MFKVVFGNTVGFNCFELLGLDIMLDDVGKPWMIEVNNLPSFETETSLDAGIKTNLLRDTLSIVGGDNPLRRLAAKQKVERDRARIYGDSARMGAKKKEEAAESHMGARAKTKADCIDEEVMRKRMLKEEAAKEKEELQQARFKHEDENGGDYFRAFPAVDDRYDAFVNATLSLRGMKMTSDSGKPRGQQ